MRLEAVRIAIARRSRRRAAAWALSAVLAALVAAGPSALGGAFFLALFGLLVMPAVFLRMRFAQVISEDTRAPGDVEFEGDAILVTQRGKTSRFDRSRLVDGWLEPYRGAQTVVLRLKNGDVVSIAARDAAEGGALLAAAGVAPSQQVMRMRLVPRSTSAGCTSAAVSLSVTLGLLVSTTMVLVNVVVIMEQRSPPPTFALAVWLALFAASAVAMFFVVRWITPELALVGADGIAVKGIGRRVFVPYADVVDIEERPGGVRILMAGDHVLWMATAFEPVLTPFAPKQTAAPRDALFARIDEALRAYRGGGEAALGEALLDRGARSFAAWREALRGLVTRTAGYRRTALEPGDLVRLVEDAAAPPERRIAAALALSASEDAGIRERVRVAAGACADDELRVALEHACDGELEEEELARAAAPRRRQAPADGPA